MKYVLYEAESKAPDNIASADLDNNFLAESWAREWASKNAKCGRYTLEGENGGFAATVFRTDAGQWYITPKTS